MPLIKREYGRVYYNSVTDAEGVGSATQSAALEVPEDKDYTIVLDFGTGTAVGTASVQYRLSNTDVNSTWQDVSNLSALTATGSATTDGPVAAFRLNVTAYTSGTFHWEVLGHDRRG